MCGLTITELPSCVRTLDEAIAGNNVEGALRAAHKMKGCAGCAGLEHISGMAAELYATLKDAKESGTGLTDSHRRTADSLGGHVAAVVRDMRDVVAGAQLPAAESAPPGVGESGGRVGESKGAGVDRTALPEA